ncbi:methyltransferase domain-containing protein [candidate division KSB3 bacterium]|uniref:Methyltransferase domain-containing protein n=1 Tax=candidate division KSB3 bacterium TaxID=2044937 RepID=A0A9D5Q5J3_9BACT|nr:methyltransferase domain-containing protein [candidate division KSB3 bacterium]MBD3324297.1 methyltransferase domain-containing protein [candidate division KSB3 bacterium]
MRTMKYQPDASQCLFCGNQSYTPLFSVQGYTLDKCLRCGLVQTHPLPIAHQIDDLYDTAYFEKLTHRKAEEAYYHAKLLRLIAHHKTTGKMLEVGIGAGIFMELAHTQGWEIEGVEPSKAACNYVAQTLHLPTHHGTVEAMPFPAKHFEVIVLRHVLEHILDPCTFLQELHRILRDDGIMCLVVPNFGGLHARVEKGQWFHLSLPYHVAHYTKKTLAALLTSCDLQIETLQTTDLSCSSYLIGLFNRGLAVLKRPPRDMYMNPREIDPHRDLAHWLVSKETWFNELTAWLGFGEEITVIAQKR